MCMFLFLSEPSVFFECTVTDLNAVSATYPGKSTVYCRNNKKSLVSCACAAFVIVSFRFVVIVFLFVLILLFFFFVASYYLSIAH